MNFDVFLFKLVVELLPNLVRFVILDGAKHCLGRSIDGLDKILIYLLCTIGLEQFTEILWLLAHKLMVLDFLARCSLRHLNVLTVHLDSMTLLLGLLLFSSERLSHDANAGQLGKR